MVPNLLGVTRSRSYTGEPFHCIQSLLSAIQPKQRGRGKTKGTQLVLHVTKHKPNKSPETNREQEREGEMRTTWPWISFLHWGTPPEFISTSSQQLCITASSLCIYSLAARHWYCYGLFCKIGLCNLSWFMARLIAWPSWRMVCVEMCVWVCETVEDWGGGNEKLDVSISTNQITKD